MDKDCVENKAAEYSVKAEAQRTAIVEKINNSKLLTDADKKNLVGILDEECQNPYGTFEESAIAAIMDAHYEENGAPNISFTDLGDFIRGLNAKEYCCAICNASDL